MGCFQIFPVLIIAALVALSELVLARPRPASSRMAVPLVKRFTLHGRDGITDRSVADLPAIKRHVDSVHAKYQQGMHNWQMNTGELDLWPAAGSTGSTGLEGKPDRALLDYLLVAKSSAQSRTDFTRVFNASATPKIFHTANIHDKGPILPTASVIAAFESTSTTDRSRSIPTARQHKARQSAPLTDVSNDLLWVAQVQIGSNDQVFTVDMDT